jgi:hypothetical protein
MGRKQINLSIKETTMPLPIPKRVPEKGFYHHYKHDPSKGNRDYAYEMVAVGVHTEDDCRPEDVHMVIYRPLYEAPVFKAGKMYDLRPIEMWMGDVEKDGKVFPRFKKVTDPAAIAELERARAEMYGS